MSEETKTTTETTTPAPTTTTKTSFMTKIWSAVVGAAVAVASMFGITQEQITAEKAKVQSIKTQATAAYEALKDGDTTTAVANLKAAIETGKQAVTDAKALAEKVKEADKKSVIETVKNEVTKVAVKDQVKKVDAAAAAYKADTAKEVKAIKKETTNAVPNKK